MKKLTDKQRAKKAFENVGKQLEEEHYKQIKVIIDAYEKKHKLGQYKAPSSTG